MPKAPTITKERILIPTQERDQPLPVAQPEAEERLVLLLKRQTSRLEEFRNAMDLKRQAFEEQRMTCGGMNARRGISRVCCPKCRQYDDADRNITNEDNTHA